jgi:hypothetical protein
MAIIEEHERDCRALLNKAWSAVHLILDQYAHVFPPPLFHEYHRTFLHNVYGVSIVEKELGKAAIIAAKIHIVRDWYEIPLADKSLDTILALYPRALLYFNNMDYFEPHVHPGVAAAWTKDGVGLAAIAFNPRSEHEFTKRKKD